MESWDYIENGEISGIGMKGREEILCLFKFFCIFAFHLSFIRHTTYRTKERRALIVATYKNQYSLRFSDPQKSYLSNRAKTMGLTWSEYVRLLVVQDIRKNDNEK